MALLKTIEALRACSPFDLLTDSERAFIGSIATERMYAPGASVLHAGAQPQKLYVVIRGQVVTSQNKPVHLPGLLSLLYNWPLSDTLVASPFDGATCLLIQKGHFYTIINECPELLLGILQAVDITPYATDVLP